VDQLYLRGYAIGIVKIMYENARMFLEGLNYKLFSMALIYVNDIADEDISHLMPAYHISRQQISEHFITRLKKPQK
jgi:hypothetical protein